VDILRSVRGVPLRVYPQREYERETYIRARCYSLPRTSEEGAFYLSLKGRHCVVGKSGRGREERGGGGDIRKQARCL